MANNTMNFGVDLLPTSTNTYNLGNADLKWKINGETPVLTDTKVTQTLTDNATGAYPILFTNTTNPTSPATDGVRYSSNIKIIPKQGALCLSSEANTANIGVNSIAIGKAEASGILSYARGAKSGSYADGAIASGDVSTAIGINSTASGANSLSFGYQAEAAGRFSVAIGLGVEAYGTSQTVIGKCNIRDTSNYAFIIGNGSNLSSRSNAMTVGWDGNVTATSFTATGNLSVGGSASFTQSPTAPTPSAGDNSTKLATTEFVSGAITGSLNNSKITIAGNDVSLGGSITADTLRTSLGLSNAMHFIGKATVAITDGSTTDPAISSYSTKVAGDVVIDKDTSYEYVWTTDNKWERLGPDSSYSLSTHTHGNITNDGKITSTATIDNGDKLVIVDVDSTAGSKLTGSSITFDGSTTTKALTPKGTWEPFNNYSLPLAASGTRGGIKIGYNESGTNYAVKLSSGKAYVTVPWTDHYVNSASFEDDTENDTNSPIKLTLTRAGSDNEIITANIPKVSSTSAGIVPKGAVVSNPSQSTRFLREDGTWAAPSYSTYTLSGLVGSSAIGSSTKPIYWNGSAFVGITSYEGNAATATKAINDSDDNQISSTYLKKSGGQMTGPLTWKNGTALPESTVPSYFLTIESSADGGTTKYVKLANAKTALGLNNYKTLQTTVTDPTANGDSLTFISTITQNDNGVITPTKKTVSTMTGATASAAGASGLVPAPTIDGYNTKYLRADGSWAVPSGENVKQTLNSNNSNFPLLMSYAINTNTTTDQTGNVYRNNSIYANPSTGSIYATSVWGAVWNDYAEFRKDNIKEKELQQPGRCVREVGDGTLALTDGRLQRGCEIISDTFGFAIGQDKENGYNTPIASTGRVLAYLYEDRELARNFIGWPVCSGPNGTVSIMTEEEENRYSNRIVGTISEIPDYEEWGTGKVKVDGRIWIRIK